MSPIQRASILATTLLAVACSDPVGPFIPSVTNELDVFSIQAPDLRNVTTTQLFAWDNSGTAATIVQSSAFTRGSATLTILDATGAQVFTTDLATQGTFQTTSGVAGEWTIHLLLHAVHGTLNLSIQKQ